MTIAKRLVILLTVPLLILVGLGIFVRAQLASIEGKSAFLATQTESLAVLGNISRSFTELRVNVRGFLLTEDKAEQSRAQALFTEDKADVIRLLGQYADTLVTGDRDRRLMEEYRNATREWIASAEKVMSLAAEGHREEAIRMLNGPVSEIGMRLSKVSGEWIQHNEQLAMDAGKAAAAVIEAARRNMFIAVGIALALTGYWAS